MVKALPPLAALHGLGVPPERVQRLADALGLPAALPADTPGRVAVLMDGAKAVTDSRHWGQPFTAWIEASPLDDEAVLAQVGRAAQADVYACLTTATANQLHLAGRIMDAIAARCPLDPEHRDDIELVLHEAISNAVVHGNLQVEGMKGLSVEALDRFSSAMANRMADPSFAGRRIEVSCWFPAAGELLVEVADEGSGFVPQDREGAGPDASGRGLDLIAAIARQVELLDHGRRIRIRFAL